MGQEVGEELVDEGAAFGVEGGDGGVVVEVGVEEAAEVGGHAADVWWGGGEAVGETSDVVW